MSIFKEDETPTKENVDNQQAESFLEQLVAKKGEKFRDPEALAKKALHGDEHIENLTAQIAQLNTYKEIVEGLKADPRAGLEQLTKPKEETLHTETKENTTPAASDIESQLEALLEKRSARERASTNLQKVEAELHRTLGETAKTVVKTKAAELGFTVERLAEIAAESPKAFFNLVGLNSVEPTRVAFGGSVNTGASSAEDKDSSKALYAELAKNPKLVKDHAFNARLYAAVDRERKQR